MPLRDLAPPLRRRGAEEAFPGGRGEPLHPSPRHVFLWDLDKTYLRVDFDTFPQLVRLALETASDKVNIPGAAPLMRELRHADTRVFIVSGSPRQLQKTIEDKLRLDGVVWDGLVMKDHMRNAWRGRFRTMRHQVGYKLRVLLRNRLRLGLDVGETMFGDDAQTDAFIYSVYADVVAGRVSRDLFGEVMDAAWLYRDERARLFELFDEVARMRERAGGLAGPDPVRRIVIHLHDRTPPAHFQPYGPRLVPTYDFFQSALVLLADGHFGPMSALEVAADLVQAHGYDAAALSKSFQELLSRGDPVSQVGPVAGALAEALRSEDPSLAALRPAAEAFTAFAERAGPPAATTPAPFEVDYRLLLDEAHPRHSKVVARRDGGGPPEPPSRLPSEGVVVDDLVDALGLSASLEHARRLRRQASGATGMLNPRAAMVLPFVVLREQLASGPRPRTPEPMVMNEPRSVAEYDAMGVEAGIQAGLHEVLARAMSRLLPEGGAVLDLGIGSGRLMARLARHRPDVSVVGLDLSDRMLETAQAHLAAEGLDRRIQLRRADITQFAEEVPERLALVSCSFALHHLPDAEALSRCLAQVAEARRRTGCAVWLFDFIRMRSARSYPALAQLIDGAEDVPVATQDGVLSEAAAWSFDELEQRLGEAGLSGLESARGFPLAFIQARWCRGPEVGDAHERCWRDVPLPWRVRADAAMLRMAFPGLP